MEGSPAALAIWGYHTHLAIEMNKLSPEPHLDFADQLSYDGREQDEA